VLPLTRLRGLGRFVPPALREAGRRSRLAVWAVWLLLLLVLFPGVHGVLGTGIDASWIFAINAVRETGSLPGRDVAFPYGPLGWLLRPAGLGGTVPAALLFRVLLHALFAAALARVLRGVPPFRAVAFAALYVLGFVLAQSEDQLVLLLALLVAPDLRRPGRVPWAPALAGALAAFFVLLKVNLGASAAAALCAFCGLSLASGRPYRRRAVVAALAAGAAVAVAAVPLVFGTPAHAWRWLGLEVELVRGFGSGMGLPAPPAHLAAGILGLGVFAGLCLYAWRARSVAAPFWTMLLLPVGLAFQHGFVRADSHSAAFLPFVLGAVALGLLLTEGEPDLRAGLAAGLLLLLLGVPLALSFGGLPRQRGTALVLGLQGWENVGRALSLGRLERGIHRAQRRALQAERLPKPFAGPIRRAGLGVDVIPWELSFLPANNLRWVPSPAFQLYSAYTSRLDEVTARHFLGPGAPDVVLVHEGRLDGREMLWDTPATWRAILAAYQLDAERPAPGLLSLRRRPRPLSWRLEERGTTAIASGRWTGVPAVAAGGEWVFAAIELAPTLAGRVKQLALGVPPVFLESVDDQGTGRSSRFLPSTASQGLLLAPMPGDLAAQAALWSGGGPRRIVRFRLSGPGMGYFGDRARVRWLGGRLAG
jgi:hypothetical protein